MRNFIVYEIQGQFGLGYWLPENTSTIPSDYTQFIGNSRPLGEYGPTTAVRRFDVSKLPPKSEKDTIKLPWFFSPVPGDRGPWILKPEQIKRNNELAPWEKSID